MIFSPDASNQTPRFALATVVVGLCGVLAVPVALAAARGDYPVRPIRFVSPFAPGGGNDTISRLVTQAMGRNMGQHFIVDNRPGANTRIGMDIVAKAAPDGYTLVMTSSSVAINVSLYPKIPYTPDDFAPVSLVAISPLIVVVHPSTRASTVKELIALARAKPGELTYASSGVGNISNLAGALFSTMAGVTMVHVPYKGANLGVTDLIAGRVSVMFSSALAMLPHIKTGKLRPLAVTGGKRSTALPALPTVAEAGLPGYEATTWYGVLAPAKTPRLIVNRLSTEVAKALAMPEVKSRLDDQGLDIVVNSPDEFRAYIQSEIVKWRKVIQAAGIKL